jgi:hypothetical protein
MYGIIITDSLGRGAPFNTRIEDVVGDVIATPSSIVCLILKFGFR